MTFGDPEWYFGIETIELFDHFSIYNLPWSSIVNVACKPKKAQHIAFEICPICIS